MLGRKGVNPVITIPVKCVFGQKMQPDKKALENFYAAWCASGKQPFTGEYNMPMSNDVHRLMATDPRQVSHCITDVHMNTYDEQKATVMVSLRFSGPRGDEASDEYIANKIRLVARAVEVKTGSKKEQRLITWDCMHMPAGAKPKALKK